jgi:hypothetical protein
MSWFVNLLNRSLNKLTGRKGLYLDKSHHRYFFQSPEPGKAVEVSYRPQRRLTHQVRQEGVRQSLRAGGN